MNNLFASCSVTDNLDSNVGREDGKYRKKALKAMDNDRCNILLDHQWGSHVTAQVLGFGFLVVFFPFLWVVITRMFH